MTELRTIAALCVAPRSIYKSIPRVECFDPDRDARTFSGGMPVVAHPPCRSWSAFCAHQAKPDPGEKDLGPLCVDWLRKEGGVLEHPAHSRLFGHCGLPVPGRNSQSDIWSIEIEQFWFGADVVKTTWLCFCRVNPSEVSLPLRLGEAGASRRTWQLKGRAQRSATPPAFAEWLVALARQSYL